MLVFGGVPVWRILWVCLNQQLMAGDHPSPHREIFQNHSLAVNFWGPVPAKIGYASTPEN